MAEVTLRKCDVYGTVKDVMTFRITIEQKDNEGQFVETGPSRLIDLGPRAFVRLTGAIDRATKPSKSNDA
jgi:hypothetical protein